MSSIHIISVPPGFAPEEIRKQWLGVVIAMPSEEEISEDPPSRYVIGSENGGGYLVLRTTAIKSLRDAGKDEAADFWNSIPLGRFLRFKKEVCEFIS